MHAVTKIFREFISLFVDDGSLAAVVLVWIAICGLVLAKSEPAASWRGPTLFIGLGLILLENVLRYAKRRIET